MNPDKMVDEGEENEENENKEESEDKDKDKDKNEDEEGKKMVLGEGSNYLGWVLQ